MSTHGDWIDVPAGELVRGTTLAQAGTVIMMIMSEAGIRRNIDIFSSTGFGVGV